MPTYIKLAGNVVEEYSPDGFTKVRIIDLGFEYAYCLEPVRLEPEEQARLEEIMERLAYRIKPRGLLNPQELEKTLKSWSLSDKVVYIVKAEVVGYSWLEPLMHDERLEDIQCFKANTPIKVTHRDYGLMRTNIVPNEDEVDRMVKLLAYRGSSAVSVYRAKEDSVILPTGDRAALTFRSEISPTSSFTIRKFPRHPWTPTRILATGMLTPEAVAFLWLCIDAKLPVVVFGPMGSGKTSLANALAMLIKPDASIAICQDAPEMRVPHENVLDLYERKSRTAGSSGEVTLEDLLAHALRRSVDYVTINEVRSRREVYAFAQAVALGHGGVTSIHAESVEAVFARLKGYNVEEPLAENIKILVGTGLFIGDRNGKRVRLRRVKGIYFVEKLESYKPRYDAVFKYDPAEDNLEARYSDVVLSYLAEKLYLGSEVDLLKHELRRRAEFLELTSRAKLYEAERLFTALKEFRHNPEETLKQLRAFFAKKPTPVSRPVIIADMSYIKYCPHCGAQLPPKVMSCPRCGFKFYSSLEEELRRVLNPEGSGVGESEEH